MENLNISQEDIIAPDGIIVIDRDKKIIAFNEAAQRITGFAEKEIVFQDYRLLFKESPSDGRYIEDALTKRESYSNLSINLTNSKGQNCQHREDRVDKLH